MTEASRHALVLRHVSFENLGSLEQPLLQRGFTIESVDAATAKFPLPQAASCDLLVVMGGPIGVYEQKDYPFLTGEIECISDRLAARKPVLGICLGAQLMAAALGAPVYPGKNGKEIGWSPIQAAPDAAIPEWFTPLLAPGVSVLHWHGDTFDLPAGATHLSQTNQYKNQAFIIENFALGLQFHPEVIAEGLENWYVGHACELSHAGISAPKLRADALLNAPRLNEAAAWFWNGWLNYIL